MGRFQYALLAYTGVSWAGDSMETMLLSFLSVSVACAWPSTVKPFQESLLTSVVFAGMLLGVYSLGAIADAVGRKKGFFLSASLLGGAGLLSALAPNFTTLVCIRFVVGFALGGTPIAVTLFSEFLPSTSRGAYVLLLQFCWTLGAVAQSLLAWIVLPHLGWRWLLVFSAVPMLLLLFCYPFLPESPHWLYARGLHQQAYEVVSTVATVNASTATRRRQQQQQTGHTSETHPGGAVTNTNTNNATHELAMFLAEIGSPTMGSPSRSPERIQYDNGSGTDSSTLVRKIQRWSHFLRTTSGRILAPHLATTTLLLWCIWFAHALTYYGLVLLTTSLQQANKPKDERCTVGGAPNFTPSQYAAIVASAVAEAPGLAMAAFFVDRKGRLWCLRMGLLACTACVFGVLVCTSTSRSIASVQMALLICARALIEGTFSVLYVYTPELYPTAARSTGLALCNCFSRMGGLCAPFATVFLVQQGKTRAAVVVLAGFLCAATLAAWRLVTETKGADLAGSGRRGSGGGGRMSAELAVEDHMCTDGGTECSTDVAAASGSDDTTGSKARGGGGEGAPLLRHEMASVSSS